MAIYIAICVSLALNAVAKKILVNQYNLQGLKGIGFLKSREDRIRTCDPLVPNQVRYRPALLPDYPVFAGWAANVQDFDIKIKG